MICAGFWSDGMGKTRIDPKRLETLSSEVLHGAVGRFYSLGGWEG